MLLALPLSLSPSLHLSLSPSLPHNWVIIKWIEQRTLVLELLIELWNIISRTVDRPKEYI